MTLSTSHAIDHTDHIQKIKDGLERIVRHAAMQEARAAMLQKALDEALAAKGEVERKLQEAEKLAAELRATLAAQTS